MLKYLTPFFLTLINLVCIAQSNDAEVLKFNTSVDYNGRNIKESYEFEIQINNGAGTKYAEIEIYFQDKNPPKDLEAEIYDVFGNKIRSLKKKEIVTTTPWSSSEFHTDRRIQTFDLIHNRFPYIIKYSYSININNYISLVSWNPILDPKIKTQHSKLTLQVPEDTPLNIFQQQMDSAKVEHIEGKDIYSWNLDNYITPKNESYAPHINTTAPTVEVMPKNFYYDIPGTASSWIDFGNWKYEIIKNLEELTPSEIKKVHQLTDTISNITDKIKTLYHYMQDNTRYILVSLEEGGLVPYPATYVCSNRFGDCKALSNYMRALLNEIGVDSYYTSIYSGLKPAPVNADFPSHQSNHIILCVPMQKDTIWLECTDKTAPFNYLGSYTQNRLALTIQENKSQLVQTPKHNINNALESYTTHVKINKENNVTFDCKGKVKGNEFDRLKSFDTQLSSKDKEQYIDHIGLIGKADILDFKISRPNRDSTWLNIDLNGTSQSISQNIGNKHLLQPFKSLKNYLEEPKERVNDLYIFYPINNCDTLIYEFPENIKEVKGLTEITIDSPFGSYSRSFHIKENKLIICRTIQVNQGYYPKEKYKDFYEFYIKSVNTDNQKVIIN
ncbi:DUF3857 domain-containing protein [Plebeiibacterium sediminum]|uniref:DUF3857 domain-containing protein n=1 Tax=Plebeiibacterium sediminum TaxID=2992112 RepID=A0AAE3M995_9BACT|nr:DUF3857 domain-containing protein [Plebeiobacterium sediminum]MCW3789185.1 DUF3857 domain-containing protein [Plebeiobacterium sediminum]